MFRLDEPPEKVADKVIDEFLDGLERRCYEGQARNNLFLTMYPEESTNPEKNEE